MAFLINLVFFIHLPCFPDKVPLLLFFLFIAPVLLSTSLHLFLLPPLSLFWFLQVLKVICSSKESALRSMEINMEEFSKR